MRCIDFRLLRLNASIAASYDHPHLKLNLQPLLTNNVTILHLHSISTTRILPSQTTGSFGVQQLSVSQGPRNLANHHCQPGELYLFSTTPRQLTILIEALTLNLISRPIRLSEAPVYHSLLTTNNLTSRTQAPNLCNHNDRLAFPNIRQLQSAIISVSVSVSSLALASMIATVGGVFWLSNLNESDSSSQSVPIQDIRDCSTTDAIKMPSEIPPGRVGNLTDEQEEKLKKLWAALYNIFNVAKDLDVGSTTESVTTETTTVKEGDKEKSKKRSLFSRKARDSSDSTTTVPSESDDKYGQTKHFQETLEQESPDELRKTLWAMVKHDDPDSLVLRFLRARKWDVEKALVMLISTVSWRNSEMHLDSDIMLNGEAGALNDVLYNTGEAQTTGQGMMEQLRMGKAFFHGCDKEGRPICFVRVRLHHQGDQTEAAQERNTVFLIETARLLLQTPVETATIVFDLTGFSISNMDYTPVKFMVKCFEANYPESLGAVLVYKAPWIFQGFWKIIRGWLDPVVANKIHFVNNVKDLASYVPEPQILKELDGPEDWTYKYVEPVEGENDTMKDTATRDKLQSEREAFYHDYEQATIRWIKGHPAAAIVRSELREKLRVNYWTLDPYIRARSMYDRIGVLGPDGKINYYPEGIPTSVSK